jgi:hypothetical protein
MLSRMPHHCSFALLLAMTLATLSGLLAWGPITLPIETEGFSPWDRLPEANLFKVITGLPLLAAALWSRHQMRLADWPGQLRRSGEMFTACTALSAAASMLHFLGPSVARMAILHLCIASAATMLVLMLLTERVDTRFGERTTIGASLGIVLLSVLWWIASPARESAGDARLLLLLEGLPLLLVPAGVFSLPGLVIGRRDGFMMLGLCLMAALVILFDGWIAGLAEILSGVVLAHLLLACVVLIPGCRAASTSSAEARGMVTQRNTSLNTAS